MLSGDDVIGVKDEIREGLLWKAAILASAAGSLPYKLAQLRIHALPVHSMQPASLGLKQTDDLRIIEVFAVLGIFLRRQFPAICLPTKFLDSLAQFVADGPIDELLNAVVRKPTGGWI